MKFNIVNHWLWLMAMHIRWSLSVLFTRKKASLILPYHHSIGNVFNMNEKFHLEYIVNAVGMEEKTKILAKSFEIFMVLRIVCYSLTTYILQFLLSRCWWLVMRRWLILLSSFRRHHQNRPKWCRLHHLLNRKDWVYLCRCTENSLQTFAIL